MPNDWEKVIRTHHSSHVTAAWLTAGWGMYVLRKVFEWASEALVKLGVILGIVVAVISLATGKQPTEVIVDLTVAVNNTIELVEQPLPITNEDVEFLIAWACKDLPDHPRCS